MSIFKDVKVICLIGVICLYTLFYFIGINKVSYAFENDYDSNNSYNQKIAVIEECAKKYGELNKDLFKDEDTVYIKVSDLVTANLIAANEDGIVKDSSSGKNLNDGVIKIKKEKDNYSVEVNV